VKLVLDRTGGRLKAGLPADARILLAPPAATAGGANGAGVAPASASAGPGPR